MLNNLKHPCIECPFKKNSLPGWLGGESVEDTQNSVLQLEADFACHMTRNKKLKQMSRCRGSLLFLKQAGKLPRYNLPLKDCLSKINIKAVGENILLPQEFIEHHKIVL